jgi:iron-sulfur cluster assembly protein
MSEFPSPCGDVCALEGEGAGGEGSPNEAQSSGVEENVFPVTVAPEAIAHFKLQRTRKGQPEAMLRVGVKGGGCSGFEYVMRMETERKATDLSVDIDGVTVLCDPKSAKFLDGATLTFTGNLMAGGFQFENPNAARSCGCGTSFTPKPR